MAVDAARKETGMSDSTELHRHRCEVRMCLEHGYDWFRMYIPGVRKARGEDAAGRLWKDVKRQHDLGNKGKPGEWIDEAVEGTSSQ
jgi:hypothetical protein